jgi:signal transduction protein with GAF and PtsI domain
MNDLLVKFKTALPYLLPQTVEKVKSELDATKAELTKTENKLNDLEDNFAEKLAQKQKETLEAISKILNDKGIKNTLEIEGEESDHQQ